MSDSAGREGPYDLQQRTARFGTAIIQLLKKLPNKTMTQHLALQLLKSATSVGANYREADEAESKRDFRHKIAICKKESSETKYWLEMLSAAEPKYKPELRKLWQEAKELTLIFAAILRRGKRD